MVVGSDAKSSILLMVMLREVAKILLIVGNGRFCIGKALENSRMKIIAVTK